VNAIEARFQRQVKALIQEEFGRPTEYAYSHRRRGSGSPRVSGSTMKQWLRKEDPSTPFSAHLVAFAEEMRTTLDYVVHGRGPRTPGLARVERELAADLRAYLVETLSRRAAKRPYDRAKTLQFFERALPKGEELLEAVSVVVLREIQTSHRERAERTRREGVRLLLKRLDQTHDREEKRRLQAQIVAGVRPMDDVPLLLDEGSASGPAL